MFRIGVSNLKHVSHKWYTQLFCMACDRSGRYQEEQQQGREERAQNNKLGRVGDRTWKKEERGRSGRERGLEWH